MTQTILTTHKQVSDLQAGDKVVMIDDTIVSVTKVSVGHSQDRRDKGLVSWSRGSWDEARIIEWRGGWTCLRYDDLVEMAQ